MKVFIFMIVYFHNATPLIFVFFRTFLSLHLFPCLPFQVIQAYLLLSTIETMRGNEEVGMRYFDHARAIHNGNAIGPDGKVLKGRPEREESLDVVFKIYGQAKTCSGESGDHQHGHGSQHKVVREQNASSALDDMISQVMSPASDAHQSGPLKALKYLSNVCGLSSEVFDPTHKCVTVKQYLGEMDTALKVGSVPSFF